MNDSYNLNELNPPKWLDCAFFEKVLHKSELDTSIKIKSCDIQPATKPGDHFTSIMFRTQLEFYSEKYKKHKTISLIVKTTPFDENYNDDIVDLSIFDNEIKMYTVTLPQIEHLMQIAGDQQMFTPRLLYQAKEPHIVIIFEDLIEKGFENIKEQLDYDDTKVVFEYLAKFHAISYYIENNSKTHNYNRISDYKIGLFDERHIESLEFLLENLNYLVDVIQNQWNNQDYLKIAYKLEKLQDTFLRKGCDVYKPYSDLSVLNHGDFHYKNLMFRRENNQIKDVYMIDFQTCIYGSPAIDIIYCLYTIASNETRDQHRFDLIQHYYLHFNETLTRIGYIGKRPTLLELNIELARCGFLEVILTICFVPFTYIDFKKIHFENLFDGSTNSVEVKKAVFNVPEFKEVLMKSLKEFLHKGLLD